MALIFLYEPAQGGSQGSIASVLKDSNHSIDTASDPDEAIEQYLGNPYSVIIVDMSDCLDSRSQYYLLEAREKYPQLPFILVTTEPERLDEKVRLFGFQRTTTADELLTMLHFSDRHKEVKLFEIFVTVVPKPIDEHLLTQLLRKLTLASVSTTN